MSGRWFHWCILAAVVASILLALPTSALAQEEENQLPEEANQLPEEEKLPEEENQLPEEGNLPSHGVVVVDMDRVLVLSQAGRNLQEQKQKLHIQLQEDTKRYEDELRTEEEDIAVMRTTEDAVDFEAAMRNFEIKVDSIRKNIQARGEAIDAALGDALRILSEHSKEALLEVADEREVVLALDHKVVLLYAVPDLTEDVIAALDARVQEVPLDVADTNE